MTVEELLKPRYKVIADYPGSAHPIGQIMPPHPKYGYDLFPYPEKYPHLFKLLVWYEERQEKDMPEYVKRNDGSEVFQRAFRYTGSGSIMVKYPKGKYGSGTVGPIGLRNLLPATESEFLNQNKQAY